MSEKQQLVALSLLEGDDKFKEFPAEDWTSLDEDEVFMSMSGRIIGMMTV